MNVSVSFNGKLPSPAIRAEIFRRVHDLERLGDALIGCEVMVLRSRVHPEIFELRILGRSVYGRVLGTRLIQESPRCRRGLDEVFGTFRNRVEAQSEVRREVVAAAAEREAPHPWFG